MSMVADVVDSALELGIAPSFTRVGSAVRSRLDHWTPLADYDASGRVVVLTGATSGLGLTAARALVEAGATVEMIGRNPDKTRAACSRLSESGGPGGVDFIVADMSDLEAVRAAAAQLAERHAVVHALVHNAGALDHAYAQSPQGIERTVASQVVGPFLLTEMLEPQLRAAHPGRVIWVASGGMYSQPLRVDALESGPDDYDGTKAYARAKRAQVTLTEMWSERRPEAGVVMQAMHPGWADTPGIQRSLPTFRRIVGPLLRTPEEGADTMVWLVVDDGAPVTNAGKFWLDRRPRSLHRLPSTRRSDTPAERRRLWEWCEERAFEGRGGDARSS
jgi:dehydrogenase/reductase SDR family member 12